jgi:hypothetical protein
MEKVCILELEREMDGWMSTGMKGRDGWWHGSVTWS